MTTLDLAFVRQQFPAFADPALEGWGHFENAGGSYPCRQVIDRLTDFYLHTKIQPGHPHPLGMAAQQAMDDARHRLADWLGVGDDELHVGPSTTANTYVLASAFSEILEPGDAIIVTQQDHEANQGPWRKLASRGVEVREWRVDPRSGHLATEGLEQLLDDRVRVVAFPAASNVVGEVNPVRRWCDLVHAAGAVSIVDAVAAAPHGLPDVEDLAADVLLFSAYKTWGPHQGVMTVRRELLDRLPNQGHFFNADQVHKRLVPAGPDHAQVAALAGIVDYVEALDTHHFDDAQADVGVRRARVNELVHRHEQGLLELLMPTLDERGIDVLGPVGARDRVPTVAVRTTRPAVEVARDLAAHRIMAAGSHFYAWRLMEALGIPPEHGVLRFSFLHYTSFDDVQRLVEALDVVER